MGARLEEASSRKRPGPALPSTPPRRQGIQGPASTPRAGLQRASLLPALCGPQQLPVSFPPNTATSSCLQAELPQVLGLCVCLSVRRLLAHPCVVTQGPAASSTTLGSSTEPCQAGGQLSVRWGAEAATQRETVNQTQAGPSSPGATRTLRWAVSQEATQSDRLCSSLSLFYSRVATLIIRGRS